MTQIAFGAAAALPFSPKTLRNPLPGANKSLHDYLGKLVTQVETPRRAPAQGSAKS